MRGSVLLIGATGQVGTALARIIENVSAPTREQFDLALIERESARDLIRASRADIVINCAGYTAVDRAEGEVGTVEAVNGSAVGVLAAAAVEAGTAFVTFSTDYVFDGTATEPYLESAIPSPINAYGRSKLHGEQLALDANPQSLVIRTSWVISSTHPNFVSRVLEKDGRQPVVDVVDDQRGSPTIASDLAAATIDAIDARATGILHLANRGSTTWYRLAVAAFGAAGLDHSQLRPCATADYRGKATRPAYTVLASERLDRLGLREMPHWEESLTGVVAEMMRG